MVSKSRIVRRIAERLAQTHSPYYAARWMEAIKYLGEDWILSKHIEKRTHDDERKPRPH